MELTRKKLPGIVRRFKLVRRLQFKLDDFIVRRSKVRYNDTPIPHKIDRWIAGFDHKNFTGLYFKNAPYYGQFREKLFFTVLEAGPSRAVDFIKTLSQQTESQIEFYRQVKFEFTRILNARILITKKDFVEHFALSLMGTKVDKQAAEFIVREILAHTEQRLEKLESEALTESFINSPVYFNPKKIKEFLMIHSIGIELGLIEFKQKGFTRKDYFKLLGKLHNIEIKTNPSANKADAIVNKSYHVAINDFIKLLKEYEKNWKTNRKNGADSDSGIDWKLF
jgi:hypothetical protein